MDRSDQELNILEEVSRVLSAGLDLEHGFERVMQLLSRELEVQRAALVLWDRGGEQMRTVASLGLTPAER
ncbi:MAG: hypothetical protein AAGA57_04000, partial [Planctomycetota bacterium]